MNAVLHHSTKSNSFLRQSIGETIQLYAQTNLCMIKIYRGEGVVDGEGSSSEGCLKWGGGGHEGI